MPCSAVSAACASSASMLGRPRRDRSRPCAIALPISLIDLILAADRPSRASLSVARAPDAVVVERIERREQPIPDRGGARGRKLLRHRRWRRARRNRPRAGAAAACRPSPRPAKPRIGGDERARGRPARSARCGGSASCVALSTLCKGRARLLSTAPRATNDAPCRPMYATRLPLRAEPERLSASRPCALGAAQLPTWRARPAGGLLLRIEDIDATRCRPGIRGGDLRGPRLARHRLGAAGAAAVASISTTTAPRWQARSAGPRLSELREPRRDRALVAERDGDGPGRAIPTARRSIPARAQACQPAERARRMRGRRALRAAARHGGGAGARRRRSPGTRPAPVRTARPAIVADPRRSCGAT